MSALTEDLKNHIDILDVVGRYVNLKRAGSNYTGLCPFHREKSPSFMVSRDKQIYKCFGCGLGGDVISFVMEYDKVDFWDAVKELATRHHFDLTPYKSEQSSIDGYLDTKDQREKIKLINKLTTKWFHEQLTQHSEASDYVHNRRQLDDTIINHWNVGYAPSNGQLLLQYLQSKGFTIADLTEAGLIRQGQGGDYYSFFRHRIIFPISDHAGNIVSFGGRIINPEDNPKYLNTSETPIYRKSGVLYGLHQAKTHIKQHNQVIIVEGYMDVIALDRLGLAIGVAPCGTSLTADHIKLITRHTTNIVAMFDNDSAGQTAGLRSVKLMLEQGIYPRIITLPSPYKDIDDLANADISPEEKQQILTQTQDWFDALVLQLQIQYPLDHPVASKQLINEMFAILTVIGDFSVFMGYLDKLAALVSIDSNGLLNQYKTRYRNNKSHTRSSQNNNPQPNYEEDIDLLLITLSSGTGYNQELDLALQLQQLKSIPSYTQQQLEEGNLRRSKTLDSSSTDQQISQIHQFIRRYMQLHTQLIIKSSTLSLDEKQTLLNQIKVFSH